MPRIVILTRPYNPTFSAIESTSGRTSNGPVPRKCETETIIKPIPNDPTIILLIFDNFWPNGFSRFAAPPTLMTNQTIINAHIITNVKILGLR